MTLQNQRLTEMHRSSSDVQVRNVRSMENRLQALQEDLELARSQQVGIDHKAGWVLARI